MTHTHVWAVEYGEHEGRGTSITLFATHELAMLYVEEQLAAYAWEQTGTQAWRSEFDEWMLLDEYAVHGDKP